MTAGTCMWPGKAGGECCGDILGHVETDFVDQTQGPHGHAEVEHGGIDFADGRAWANRSVGLEQGRGRRMRLSRKPGLSRTSTGILPIF